MPDMNKNTVSAMYQIRSVELESLKELEYARWCTRVNNNTTATRGNQYVTLITHSRLMYN